MEKTTYQEGPQSFAPRSIGAEPIDQGMLLKNKTIELRLLQASYDYERSGDLRWFFAYAHGMITRQINGNLSKFQRPNALIRLNNHFAEAFLRAVNGLPSEQWKKAFKLCEGLKNTNNKTLFMLGEAELCGAGMANVHIRVDLTNALQEVGCIPPEDYGNVLIFVNRGSLAALTKLRGALFGPAEAIANQFVAPFLDMEVRTWRDASYQSVCNARVPDPTTDFVRSIK